MLKVGTKVKAHHETHPFSGKIEQIILAKQRLAEKKELFIARGLKDGFVGYDENNKLVIL